MKEVLNDIDGKESSKRKTGIRLVNVAVIIAAVYFLVGLIMALLNKKFNYNFPFEVWLTIIGLGASLLGSTLIERFAKIK